MALDATRRFLFWLYQEQLVPHDLSGHVAKYRLDEDPEPRATPAADVAKLLSVLDLPQAKTPKSTVLAATPSDHA